MKHFAICILLILTACNPCKRLIRLCPPSDSTAYIETIDTVILTVPESITETEFPLGLLGLKEETEKQKIEVIVKDSVVFIRTTCKEQEREIFSLRKKLASQKTIIKRVEIPTLLTKNSKYHTIAGILSPLLALLFLGTIVLLFKRKLL